MVVTGRNRGTVFFNGDWSVFPAPDKNDNTPDNLMLVLLLTFITEFYLCVKIKLLYKVFLVGVWFRKSLPSIFTTALFLPGLV